MEKGSRFADLPRASTDIHDIHTIRSGKFRRYHGDSWLTRLLDVPTNARNLRDSMYVVAGFAQSRRLLKKLRPDVIFIKGSSVGVPIGKAARSLGIPYFTHDSDSVASLTNRLLAKHAVYHAVGMPPEFYDRTDDKLRYTGIPLGPQYKHVDGTAQRKFRRALGLPVDALVLTVTGGSLGAKRLNKAVVAVAEALLRAYPNLHILHQTGSEESVYQGLAAGLRDRVVEVGYSDELATLTGAADLVVGRAGATTIAELAVQGKASLFVPNPQLTGGQQTKNSEYLMEHHAAVVLSEEKAAKPAEFEKAIRALLDSTQDRRDLADNIAKLAKPEAAAELTAIIAEIAQNQTPHYAAQKQNRRN